MHSPLRPGRPGGRRSLAMAVALACALAVAASLVGLGRAGSVRTGVTIEVLPHVLTLNAVGTTPGFLAANFTNAGPSTVNHVVETITADGAGNPLPLPPSAFTTPSGCVATASGTGSIITCNLGQVGSGTVQRLISFAIPAGTAPFTFSTHVAAAFDEGKNTGLTDTVSSDDSAAFVSSTDGTKKGQCLAGAGGTLTAVNANQQTFLNYPALPTSRVPCTPGDTGVAAGHPTIAGSNLFGDTSFVEFLDGNGLGTVQISIFTRPSGVTKSTLRFLEYANYPDLTPTVGAPGTPYAGTLFVPSCVTVGGQPTIPANSGFRSCVVKVDNLSGGGLIGTLKVQGGTDPGWGSGRPV